jgi:aldehyde dehydrogenase (NAD+)
MENDKYARLSKKYIEGSGEVGNDINPANGKPLAKVRNMTAEDATETIEKAVIAYSRWSSMTPPARGRILYRAGEIAEREKEFLATLMTEEEGKTYNDSLSEVTRSIELLKFYGMLSFKYGGIVLPSSDQNTRIFTVRVPMGTVGLISPWNFPLSIPVWKAAPALAMGNTAVMKPATKTPILAAAFLDTLVRAGLPENVMSLVVGPGSKVGDAIIRSEDISAISFTGSVSVGNGVYKGVGEKNRFTRVQLELGGKNAVYVDESADLSLAVNFTLRGAFGLTGQSCTATSRLIVHKNVYNRVRDGLLSAVKTWIVGNGLEKETNMGPVVDEQQLKTDLDYIQSGKEEGAKLIAGGSLIKNKGSKLFLQPTIFDSVASDMKIFKEEIFGPVLSITVADNLDQAINLVNSVDYGHTSAIFATNSTAINRFIYEVRTGVIKVNKPTVGLELQAPFGTLKSSGANTWKEMGESALEFYSTEKAVYEGW